MPHAQDAQQRQPGQRGESVMFETWYEGLEALQGSPEQRRAWADLLEVRSTVAKMLESMRNDGAIGAALEAEVTLYADFFPFADLIKADTAQGAQELHFFFITSGLQLAAPDARPDDAVELKTERVTMWISAKPSDAKKCIRCWHRRADVGVHAAHPEICGRCVENLPGARGENRRFF